MSEETFQNFKTCLNGAMSQARIAREKSKGAQGLSTGKAALDEAMGGLHPSDLIVLAARPGMGKTAFACDIAFHFANTYLGDADADVFSRVGLSTPKGGAVGFFSLADTAETIAWTILTQQATIQPRGEIWGTEEYEKALGMAQSLETCPIFVDDRAGLTIDQLCASAHKLKREHCLGLIIVDYLQLVQTSLGQESDNHLHIITSQLKALARELDLPVIALSQLLDSVETRELGFPELSDLEDSDLVRRTADVIMFLYREADYLLGTEPVPIAGRPFWDHHSSWDRRMQDAFNVLEVILVKNREDFMPRSVRLGFNPASKRFSDYCSEAADVNACASGLVEVDCEGPEKPLGPD